MYNILLGHLNLMIFAMFSFTMLIIILFIVPGNQHLFHDDCQ